MKAILLSCCVFALAGFSVRAASVDDVIAMAQKGEPEDKQIAAVDNTPGEIGVGAPDILRLREAKVPEKVIVAILRHVPKNGRTAAAAPGAPAPAPAPAPVPQRPLATNPPQNPTVKIPVAPVPPVVAAPVAPAAPPVVRNVNQDGSLTIENLDDRGWAYMYEPAIQTIWISFPSQGSLVQGHGSTTLSMHAGNYTVRFSGTQTEGFPLTVNGGERSAINISRVTADGIDTLNVSIFEHGERRASGKLATLNNQPSETVVEQRPVVTGPTYYVTPPVYYNSGPYYYYGPGYYRPYYYGGPQFNLGFNFGGGGHYRH